MDHDTRQPPSPVGAADHLARLSSLLEAERDPSVDYAQADLAVFEWMTSPAFLAEAKDARGTFGVVAAKLAQLLIDLSLGT